MRNIILLVISGMFLISFGFYEKIIIFIALNNTVELRSLIDRTPNYIWQITNITIGLGIIQLGIALYLFINQKNKGN